MEDASPSSLNPPGGLPRRRMKFVYIDPEGVLTGVVWEASGEVRTVPPGDYQSLVNAPRAGPGHPCRGEPLVMTHSWMTEGQLRAYEEALFEEAQSLPLPGVVYVWLHALAELRRRTGRSCLVGHAQYFSDPGETTGLRAVSLPVDRPPARHYGPTAVLDLPVGMYRSSNLRPEEDLRD